jgi:PIN like domain
MTSRRSKSKKPSSTKEIPEKRLEPFTFFVDRSLGGITVPDLLRAIGLKVEVHADHFKHDAPDTEWLERCGAEGWIVLAKDKAIKKNPLERRAIITHGLAAFFLVKTSATGEENAEAIIKGIQKIIGVLENQRRPFIARVHPDGRIELWVNHRDEDLLAEKEARRRMKKNT